jgi:PPOX class probable F420-dependent enzyme
MNELASLKNTKTVLLTTYKRDSTPVATAVSIAFDGDRAYFRSYDKAWKTKRLRNNPRVLVAASSVGGKATGPEIAARARLLSGADERAAARALAGRHRVLQALVVPLMHRIRRYRTMHYELEPDRRMWSSGNGLPASSTGERPTTSKPSAS